MKYISQMIVRWYLALTLLAIFAPITLSVLDVFAGLLFMWMLGGVFLLGLSSKSPKKSFKPIQLPKKSEKTHLPLLVAIGAIPISLFLVRFYTGNTFGTIVASLSHGQSLYRHYQVFFQEQELWRFALYKIPAILSGMLLKLALIYIYIRTLILDKRVTKGSLAPLMIVTLAYLLFSTARGTTFEIFEIFLLFWFSLTLRSAQGQQAGNTPRKANIALVLAGLLSLMIYNYNILTRYDFRFSRYCITAQLCKDPNAWIYSVSSMLGDLIFQLSGYFTFGIFFAASFISVWTSSLYHFLMGFIPFGIFMNGGDVRHQLCGPVIDCGAAWVPDSIIFLQYLGLFGLFLSILLLGRLTKTLFFSILNKREFHTVALLYFIILIMFSLPVGNFLLVSSSNILAFFTILLSYLYTRLDFQRVFRKYSTPRTKF